MVETDNHDPSKRDYAGLRASSEMAIEYQSAEFTLGIPGLKREGLTFVRAGPWPAAAGKESPPAP